MLALVGQGINRQGIDKNQELERKMEELKKELTVEMARISRQIQELTRDLRSLNAKMISIQEGGRYF